MANIINCLGVEVLGDTQIRLRDIALILRNGLLTNISNFLSSTSNDSLMMTVLRRLITDLDYTPFSTTLVNQKKEKYLLEILHPLIFRKYLEDIKKIILLLQFHENSNNYFDLYDVFAYSDSDCEFCGKHMTTTYVLDDYYNGFIMVKNTWDCDDEQAFCRFSVDMSLACLKQVLKGEASYNIEHRKLTLSGDIETNPGPDSRIQDLEKQIKELQERLKRLDNKSWRDQDREKTRKKRTRRIAQGVRSLCSNTGAAMNVMANGMGPVLESIRSAMDTITKTGSDMKAAFKVPDHVDLVGSLLSVAQLVDAVLKKNLFACSLICTQLARQCGVSFASFMTIFPTLKGQDVEFTDENSEPKRFSESLFSGVQNLEDMYPLIAIGSVLTGIVTLFCKGKVPSVKDSLAHFGVIGRAAQGFRAVRDFFGWLWEYIMGVYCQAMYGITYEEYKMTKEFPEIGKICGGIKVAETISKELISNSSDICKQIISMRAKLDDYILEATRIRSKNLSFIVKLRDRLKEKYDLAIVSPAIVSAIREEPVCVYLYGQPGVGKSVMTTVMVADYYKEFLADRGVNYNSVTHSRKAVNEHWDGYTNQPILIVDDFGNKKDNTVNPCTEYEELQYMVNTSEYPLWMADLAKKGVTYFNSELVLLSSNLKFPEIVHMVDPSSIFRRVHIWAEVVCKKEYGTLTGCDKDNNKFYQFDRNVTAKTQGKKVEDVEPLMTEQYLIKLYKVSMDKHSGSVVYQDLNHAMNYSEFYDYFKKVKTEKTEINKKLSAAIRTRAGLEGTEDKQTERQILDLFRDVFDPEEIIELGAEKLANCTTATPEQVIESVDPKNDKEKVITKIEAKPCSCPKKKCVCGCKEKNDCVCIFDPHIPIMTREERKEFDIQFGDVMELDYCNATDMDVDLVDIALPSAAVGAWRIKLKNIYTDAKNRFAEAVKCIYAKVACGVRRLCGSMIGVAGALLDYVGAALGKALNFVKQHPLNALLVSAFGLAIGYLGDMYYRNVPSACEFSLTLNDVYVPCTQCDVCNVMQYTDEGGYLDHFLRRIGVPQVRAALMRCRIWTDDYLSRILHRTEEKVRFAERVYSGQPAVPRPTHYAQALFGTCGISSAVEHIRDVGMNYTEAMRLLGSKCKFNCNFCCTREYSYDPCDKEDIIRVGQKIFDDYVQYSLRMILPLPLQQGSKRMAESDIVRVEQCTQILAKNSVWVQAVTRDGSASKSTGTFVVGRTLVTTAHSVMNSECKFEKLLIQNPNSKETLDFPVKDCKISRIKQADGKPTDLAMITLPNAVPSRPKILSKFIKAKDLDLLQEGDIVLSGFKIFENKLIMNEQQTKRFDISTKTTSYFEHPAGCARGNPCPCEIRIGNHINYEVNTFPGCCGSLISAQNKTIPAKIIGFHVAGVKGEPALGVILTNELLCSALQDHITEFSLPSTYMIDGKFPICNS